MLGVLPASGTADSARRQIREYGNHAGSRLSAPEEDHLIALQLGGSPTSPQNLWPEAHYPKPGSYQKDSLENYLHRRVCDGRTSLRTAQHLIATNWLKATDASTSAGSERF